jgi:hypothetical protein
VPRDKLLPTADIDSLSILLQMKKERAFCHARAAALSWNVVCRRCLKWLLNSLTSGIADESVDSFSIFRAHDYSGYLSYLYHAYCFIYAILSYSLQLYPMIAFFTIKTDIIEYDPFYGTGKWIFIEINALDNKNTWVKGDGDATR